MDEKLLEKMLRYGKRWTKNDMDRIYFDAKFVLEIMGYTWNNYKTGNISSAYFKGEKISNSKMYKVINDISYHKYFYDLKTNTWKDHQGVIEKFMVSGEI